MFVSFVTDSVKCYNVKPQLELTELFGNISDRRREHDYKVIELNKNIFNRLRQWVNLFEKDGKLIIYSQSKDKDFK